jgi:hypothetical protein
VANQICRFNVISGLWNDHPLTGDPLHVESTGSGVLSFFAERHFGEEPTMRCFTLVATGAVVPEDWTYWGTGRSPHEPSWHLYEVPWVEPSER